MKRLFVRILMALVGLLLGGTIATFLQTTSLVSTTMALLVFTGMILTFLLGVYTGMRHVLHRRSPGRPVVTLPLGSGDRPVEPSVTSPRRF